MVKHKKPTNEELEESIKKSTEEAEKLVKVPNETVEDTPIDLPIEKPVKEEVEAIEEKKKVVEEPIKEEVKEEPKEEPLVDYKKKFTESSREAQVLHSRQKKLTEAVDQASQIEEPSDEEMVKDFSDWDVMSETEKRLAKDNVINKRRFEAIHKASQEGKDIIDWNVKVDKYVDDPKTLIDNPELEGKVDDFKIFASKPTRRGLDFADLTSAFLYDMSKSTKPKSKGRMFETGSGGPNEKIKPKGDKISLAEARTLMKNNYKKYKEYLTSGKIDMSTLE
jgi:hypothetical protein